MSGEGLSSSSSQEILDNFYVTLLVLERLSHSGVIQAHHINRAALPLQDGYYAFDSGIITVKYTLIITS